jgi:hypothetical protein
MGVLHKGQKVETSKRKERGTREQAAEGSTSSPALEVLQRMSENRSRIEEKMGDHN